MTTSSQESSSDPGVMRAGDHIPEGRRMQTGMLNVMWEGVWVEVGNAEFLVEGNKIVKVVSYTPREFNKTKGEPWDN